MAAEAPARVLAEERSSAIAAVPDGARVLVEEMDRINLSQALKDTDIATQRVQDLSARLVSLSEENSRLSEALDDARSECGVVRGRMAAVQGVIDSRVFRAALGFQRVRARLRSR